jgi:thioredoxin reductase (NADPH)
MTDCIIIGSGVAGISAALTLQANRKTFMIFGSAELSEKIKKAETVHNYPGFADIEGQAFVQALQAQLSKAEIAIKEEKVSGVYALNGKFGVATQEGGYYESATIILACGVENVKEIAGETEFLGRGVSYCATCDGFLYKDKTIAALCTSKRLEHEVEHLAGFAKKVYLIAMYKDVDIALENVEFIRKMPQKIQGDKRINGVVFANETLPVDGFFALRESFSPSVLLNGLQMQDGYVAVTRDMQTNIEGCFAAGDCTGRPFQYAKAVGEGNVAAHAVSAYLSTKKA